MLLLLLAFVVVIVLLLYFIGLYNERYWLKRGVKFYSRNKVMGPIWDFVTGNRGMFEIIGDMYKLFPDEPAVGFGSLLTPSVFVSNVKNVQYVMQGHIFNDRAVDYNEKDYLADNILFMKGVRWKLMRQKMTPLFTPIKLKNMYYIIDKSAQDFVDYLTMNPEKLLGNTFDTLTTFCCAAIGGAVFGVTSKSTFDSPFLEVTRKAFSPNFFNNFRFIIMSLSNTIFRVLQLKFFKQFEPFFIGAMKQVFKQRKEEGAKKHDFADICLSIQQSATMKSDETGLQLEPTDELLAAQGFFFFTAGVEPTATGIFGAMIEIGRHPDVQSRLQEEIDNVFEKHNGKLSYDAIAEMEYLDKVLNESMRMYPPIGFLTKRCTESTVLPDGNIKIEKGTRVLTPIYHYHHDPQYFEDPHKFDPDRFSDELKQNLGVIYQPFGFGGRICIGIRYARLQVKSCLAHILRHFNLETRVGSGGIKYGKDQIQVRMKNVDVIYIPRKNKIY